MSKLPFSVYDTFAYLASGLIVAVGVDHAFGLGFREAELGVVELLSGTVALYVLGHLVAHLASALLERLVIFRWLGRPEEQLFGTKDKPLAAHLFRTYFRPFPREILERLGERAAAEDMDRSGRGFFYLCRGVAQRDPIARERMASFLNLYGFCRNASLAFLACALALLAAPLLARIGVVSSTAPGWQWLGVGALMTSAGLFVRYLKFFRHYTMEAYLAVSASEERKAGAA